MQFSVFALLLLVAGAFAFPQVESDERPPNAVEQRVINAVRRYTEFIRLIGLDPIKIKKADSKRILIQGILEVRSFIEELEMSGGSNVLLKYVDYNFPLRRLRVNFVVPELRMKIGKAGVEIKLLDVVDTVLLAGSVSIRGVTLSAEVSFNLDWDGLTVRSITIDSGIDEVESQMKLVAFEKDHSDYLNRLVGERILIMLKRNKNELDRGLEVIIRRILESIIRV